MNFTSAEQQLIVKNVTSILEFVKKEVCPFIRTFYIFKFSDDPTRHPIMFKVFPGKRGTVEFTRGYDFTQYKLGDPYDPYNWSKDELKHRYDLWKEYDVMYAFIESWSDLKKEIMITVERDKNVSNTLNNFTV